MDKQKRYDRLKELFKKYNICVSRSEKEVIYYINKLVKGKKFSGYVVRKVKEDIAKGTFNE